MHWKHFAAGSILTTALLGCTEPHDRTVTTQTDAQALPTPRLELVTVVDETSGVEYGVGQDYDRLSDGSVVYLDGQASMVRVFGPEGRYRHSFGKEGQGPGEFQRAFNIEVGPGDRVAVADFMNKRVSVFTSEGALLHELGTPWPGGGRPDMAWGPGGLWLHVNGELQDQPERGNMAMIYRAELPSGAPAAPTRESLSRILTMGFGTRLTELEEGTDRGMPADSDTVGIGCPGCSTLPGPNGGIAFVSPRPLYRVIEIDTTATVLGRWERTDRQPVRYTDEERDRFNATQRAFYERLSLAGSPPELPEFRAHLAHHGLGFDHRARLWTLPVVGPDTARSLDVFDEGGTFARTLHPPSPPDWSARNGPDTPFVLESIKVRGDHILGLAKNAWDLPVIVVYRIVG